MKTPFLTPKKARLSLRGSLCAAGFAAGLLTSTTFGGTPRLSQANPAGGQRGGEIEVTFGGSNFEDAKSLLFDQPGFETTIIEAQKGSVRAKVKIGPDVRLGEHSFRVVTASGLSDVRLFFVTPFPMVAEAPESKDKPNEPQPVALGTTVYAGRPRTIRTSLSSK